MYAPRDATPGHASQLARDRATRGEPPTAIAEEALKVVKTAKLVRCVATAFAASSIDCELVYDDRTISPDTLAHHKSEVIIGIARAFEREKIEFAYPTQTTYTAAPDGTLVMPWAPPKPSK